MSQGRSLQALAALVIALAWQAFVPQAFANSPADAAAEWQGEYFNGKQGGVFLKIKLQGFKVSKGRASTFTITNDAQVTVFNILNKKPYVLSQPVNEAAGVPRKVWKLPSGKYAIRTIELVDAEGSKRRYAPARPQTFAIKRACLANLGVWTLKPDGPGLGVTFAMNSNPYKETGDRRQSSIVAVINGFNGLIQERFAGKELLHKGEAGYEGKSEMRAVVTSTRQISMFFRLDLFRHNHHAREIADILTTYDANLRTCYSRRLDDNPKLQGEIKFNFILAKDTGTMSKLKHRGGSIDDPKLVECLYYELAQIQFPVREAMLGELTYTFASR